MSEQSSAVPESAAISPAVMQEGLWIGLVLAAIFITAVVRLRRDREPV